jgi:high affinity Mn2+ porin
LPPSALTRLREGAAILVLVLATAIPATAQPAADAPEAGATTMLPHPDDSRWWLSGQVNLISQTQGRFRSPYEGDHSLRPNRAQALSRVWTIFTGVKVSEHTELLLDVESAGGGGLSGAFGLAGFTDLDVVRNPTLGSKPYLARLMVHHTIALSGDRVRATRGAFSLAAEQPARRLELRAGKLGLVDFFDLNSAGGDSHLQFTNWTVDNNGAYDYAADTRGYTWGAVVEYASPAWSVRGAEVLMPKVANGIVLDWNISRARGENVELELRPRSGVAIRALGYVNHANMGDYDEAIQAFRAGVGARPDIEAHRRQGRRKYGVGGNVEYALAGGVRLFARTGWNEGRNESFAYTEVNNSGEAGGDVSGERWRRPQDRVGLAMASNGLSAPHREYLRLGGLGFLLGDGTLRYAREGIVESYYNAHLWRGVFIAADLQRIANPGYNQDRGPVHVGTVRLHLEF